MPKVKFNKEVAFSYMEQVMKGETMSELFEWLGKDPEDFMPVQDYIIERLAHYKEGELPQELEQAIYDLFDGILDRETLQGVKESKLQFMDAAYIHLLADICQDEYESTASR